MNQQEIEIIKASLDLWFRMDTWASRHALDDRRFHKALAAAFQAVEPTTLASLDTPHFRQALSELAQAYRRKGCDAEIERFATRAGIIVSYVQDVTRDD